MKKTVQLLKGGVFTENPVLVQLLGLCPVLAVSTTLVNAFGMGAAVTAVLIGSNIVISILRRAIPPKIRIPCFVVVIAGFVTLVDLLFQAYWPGLSDSLGLFIPLIVVNCIVLARAEVFACKNGVYHSAVDGLAMGVGFALALAVVSAVREMLGNGTLMGYTLLPGYQPVLMMLLPPGGFLTLGFVAAAAQKMKRRVR